MSDTWTDMIHIRQWTDTKSYTIEFCHETSLKATFCSLALIWGSLSVLWRLLLQLAECEPCLCRGLNDESITWTFLNIKLKSLKLKIDSWRLRDHERFPFHVESTWRCSKVSIVKLPWSPWFSMSQVSLLSWLVESKIHHRKNGTSWVFFRSLQVSILWGLSQCSQMCFHVFSIQSSLVILLEMVCHLFYVAPEVKSHLASRYIDVDEFILRSSVE